MSLKPTVIGITGPFGSGKTTASSFFETKGYRKITLSSFLEEELRDKGKPITRTNLQDLGNEWRSEQGGGVLAKKALEFINDNNIKKAVIDGIRNLGEIGEFRKSTEFVLLGITADRKIRFERVKNLRSSEELTQELFDQLDYRDLGIIKNGENDLQVAKCLAIADFFINSNDEPGFEDQLLEFLQKM